MSSIFEINRELIHKMHDLSEKMAEGYEPTDEDVNALLAIDDKLDDKLINIAKFIKNTSHDATAIKAEIERLTAKKRAIEKRNDWLKSVILSVMSEHDKSKIANPIISITRQNSKAVVIIDDEAAIDEQFISVQTLKSVNKTALYTALKSREVAGAHLEPRQIIKLS